LLGTFEGGFYSGGVKEKWTGLCRLRLPEEETFWEAMFSFEHDPLPMGVRNKLNEARDGIVSGGIVVPGAF